MVLRLNVNSWFWSLSKEIKLLLPFPSLFAFALAPTLFALLEDYISQHALHLLLLLDSRFLLGSNAGKAPPLVPYDKLELLTMSTSSL